MKKIKLVGLSVLAIVSLFSAAASAKKPEPRHKPKQANAFFQQEMFAPFFYAGVGTGTSRFDPDENNSNWQVSNKNDIGYKIYGGYRFAKQWFAEAHYADLGEVEFSHANSNLANETISYKVPAVYLGYYLPFNNWFSTDLPFNTYIKAGAAFIENKSNGEFLSFDQKHSVQIAAGVGVEYPFGKRWALRAEIESFDTDANFANLSIAYSLGQ